MKQEVTCSIANPNARSGSHTKVREKSDSYTVGVGIGASWT